MSQSNPRRILVIKLGAFGDVILALGTMAAIRARHPDAEITLLTTKLFVELMEKTGYFDHVWPIRRWSFFDVADWAGFARKLRDDGYDAAYDLQSNDRTKLFYYLAPKALQKNWLRVRKSKKNPAADKVDGLLDMSDMARFPIPDMTWLEGDISRFKLQKPFVLLVPGCSPRHPGKRWPASSYAVVAAQLHELGYAVAAIGTAAEQEIIADLTRMAPTVVDLSGKTSFVDIASLARQAAGAIGNDTGPMHLIAAVGCPVVSLFSGLSDPAQSAPRGRVVQILRAIPIETLETGLVLKTFLQLQN